MLALLREELGVPSPPDCGFPAGCGTDGIGLSLPHPLQWACSSLAPCVGGAQLISGFISEDTECHRSQCVRGGISFQMSASLAFPGQCALCHDVLRFLYISGFVS